MKTLHIRRTAALVFSILSMGAAAWAQDISVSPKLVKFGNQGIGTTSAGQTVTLLNNQPGTLTISGMQISAPYAETDNCGSTLAPNAQCTINVTFAPAAKQYYPSTLTITDNAENSPQTISLTGNGVDPVTFSPVQILFPNQGIYSTSSAYTFSLTNNQSSALAISGISTAAPFAQTNNCGSSLAGGASCTVTVTFTPTTVKYFSASVAIADNAPNSPQQVPVTGNGILPVKYTPVQGGFYFNHQITGTSSTPQTVTVTNEQNTPLTFSGITSPSGFPFTTNCGDGSGGGTLAAGASCTLQVSFDPAAANTYTGNVLINENAYGSPITIPVTGTGIPGTMGPNVTVTPRYPCLEPGASQQFTANFFDTSSTPVNWYIDGVLNGNATTGTITAAGVYTASAGTGSHNVRANSQSNSSLGGSATVTVSTATSFQLYPYVATITPGGQQTFQGQECMVPDTNVTFQVDSITGGNSTVGTITSSGVYTAPAKAGKHQVRVTDATLNKTTAGVVDVINSITADFGGRANNTAAVPPNMFGYGRGESLTSTAQRTLLYQGGITEARLSAEISMVYAIQTPDWTKIDPFIASIQAAGQHAMLQLKESPPYLQPTSGACAANSVAAPTDVNQWAQMAAAYVAHMDSAFPGVVTDYEVWNEPNTAGMCATNHLSSYLALYAAAAPAMKAQAAQDGQTIRVGGPVLSGFAGDWTTALLTNATTAPYVDFVSYHQYFYGQIGLGATWDTYNGNNSIYQSLADPTTGAFGDYKRTYALVAAGKQPGGAKTPIYVTEYNANWAFFQDCCRNDPTYAPVFNALYITDMLDSVYNGIPSMPAQLDYFAGSAYPYFCLIGVQDSNNDCLASVGATLVPYPQYYAFQLIGGSGYLGLANGGYMAKSISAMTGGGGIASTAFYTANQDSILIVNPTSTSYSQIPVTLANPGLSGSQGTLYSISNGAQINSTAVSFTVSGTNLTTNVDIPAYSVQAISLP